MGNTAQEKWDKAAKFFDRFNGGAENRYGPYKKELFSGAKGRVLFVAAGTGLDFPHLPPGQEIYAIDFSQKMLEKAAEKSSSYSGTLHLLRADVECLPFPDDFFDAAATSCTFCSVPDPVAGLKELHRTLKPGGTVYMFEHVRPENPILGLMTDAMTPLARFFGPDLNRRTGENLKKAGFELTREYNVYLDMVKLYEARKDRRRAHPPRVTSS